MTQVAARPPPRPPPRQSALGIQVKTWFGETPCWRATYDTDMSGA